MKKILILGAGLMQKPAIMAAKNLGYKAYVVDANPNAPCVQDADVFEKVDLKDREGLLSYAKKIGEDLDAVFTAGTDFSASVSYVAEKMGLKSHSFEASLNASDKVRMRGCFEKEGVPSPSFREIKSVEDLADEKYLDENGKIGYPKVIKPCDNMGARGCRLIRNENEAVSSVKNAVKYSRTGRAILEDYMEGPEFSIDSVVYDGTLTITGFADRHIYYPPYFIEVGHTMPSVIDEKMKNELIATFALGIKALGLTHGVAKADIKYTKDGPMIGEIAARLSGGYMSGWTFPLASDFPLTETALELALGKIPERMLSMRKKIPWQPHESVKSKAQPFELFEIPCKRFCCERAWMSVDGNAASQKLYFGETNSENEIVEIDGNFAIDGGKIEKNPDLLKNHEILILPRTKIGDKVGFPRNNVEKCGNVLAVGKDFKEAEEKAYKIIENIVVELEKNSDATKKYLEGKCALDEENFPPKNYENFESGKMDFNHRTIEKTLEFYEKISGKKADLSDEKTASAAKNAGIQGILFLG